MSVEGRGGDGEGRERARRWRGSGHSSLLPFLIPPSGDASAEFRLAAFFPAPVTPVVDAMADVCDRAVKQMAALSAMGDAGGADGLPGSGGVLAAGGGKVDDAASQRRRCVFCFGFTRGRGCLRRLFLPRNLHPVLRRASTQACGAPRPQNALSPASLRTIERPPSPFPLLFSPLFSSERGQRALEERLKAKTGAVLKPVADVEVVTV